MKKGSSLYTVTMNPRLYCPDCKTHLKISNLQKKYWCKECYGYIPPERLTDNFIRGIE